MLLVLMLLLGSLALGLFSKKLSWKTYLILAAMVVFAIIGFLYLGEQFL